MFFENELNRHLYSLNRKFSPKELSALMDQAIMDLKNRSVAGAVIVPASFLLGGFATDYASERMSLFIFIGSILSVATLIRISAIVAFSRPSITNRHSWIAVFFWSNLFMGISWGLFSATSAFFYHDSLHIALIIIILAGIGGGSMVSYCIWEILSYSYLLSILVPTVLVEFYIGNNVTIPIGIAVSFFLIFNLVQTKIWNKHYWLSLINEFVVQSNAIELKKLNAQLSDEILEHKQTAKNIAVSSKKLQDIYNSAHDGIFIFELSGQVIDINETMLKMFNISRQDALKFDINRSFQSIKNKNVDLATIWKEALVGNDQEFTWLTRTQDRDDYSTVQVNLKRSQWGDDSVIIATVRDITFQVEAMRATSAANHAKSEFIANISHELRTPIHGILGYARLGAKRFEVLPKHKINEYFTMIQESGTRLMTLLDNVLDFSKLEIGKMRYTMRMSDLLPRIHQVVREIKANAAEKELKFEIKCEQEQLIAFYDQEKIVQVLRNLLFNAVKFSNEQSSIQIDCITLKLEDHPSKQQISVTNQGIAIPKDELITIFDKFIQSSTTNTGAGGTGLGLAISKQILRDHNSIIWAENSSDGKTIFRFLLPMGEIE